MFFGDVFCYQSIAVKNIECKTLEGLIYLLKINYVDEGLFDRNLFRFFFCKSKELNFQFLQIKWRIFEENVAFETFNKTKFFIGYSKNLLNDLPKIERE